jgi:hypothetical protein
MYVEKQVITEKVTTPEILNSWKEIAGYLDRGVRTVQRWEADLHLPVHRPQGHARSAVFALRSELDQWIKSCPKESSTIQVSETISILKRVQKAGSAGAEPEEDRPEPSLTTVRLIIEGRRLVEESRESRAQLKLAMTRLLQTMGGMWLGSPKNSPPPLNRG